MEPHVLDFGIAKLIDHSSASAHFTSVMGTIGYFPPETAFTTTTTMAKIKKRDVYSYGVVLLELITRKKALDPSFPEDTNIAKWVFSTWNSNKAIEDIVDPSLVDEFVDSAVMVEVIKVMLVALRCTSKDPSHRRTMRDVVKQLKDAKVK
ncbi:Protein kinase domain [Macleaya cordata]|uniref:Protein kinase domain n=1 Tax=Macleaya cordata TaxID=56857 RepID=A0A200Q1U2_MACCD|nr:Protein kinase domain [Macleaya cordata]